VMEVAIQDEGRGASSKARVILRSKGPNLGTAG
jgi:hypothetical protein